jgi:hypothetical protein
MELIKEDGAIKVGEKVILLNEIMSKNVINYFRTNDKPAYISSCLCPSFKSFISPICNSIVRFP